MKKVTAIFLAMCLCVGMCACVSQISEEDEVRNYLTSYNWYRDLGGNVGLKTYYEFNNDGTCAIRSRSSMEIFDLDFTGTYEIDTQNRTITIHNDSSSGETSLVWTYTLYDKSMSVSDKDGNEILIEK